MNIVSTPYFSPFVVCSDIDLSAAARTARRTVHANKGPDSISALALEAGIFLLQPRE